jgi:hypothetical protein
MEKKEYNLDFYQALKLMINLKNISKQKFREVTVYTVKELIG